MNGKNAELAGHPGREYWKSRLHKYGEEPGRYTKYLTHKKERREAKKETTNYYGDYSLGVFDYLKGQGYFE